MQDLSALPIAIPYKQIVDFCEKWHITEFALFGSVLRDDFTDDSDVDVLVTFREGLSPTLFQMVEMEDELAALFHRPIDLLTRKSVEDNANYLRRKAILQSVRIIYANG